jgi:hypothetical protein
MSTCTCTLHIFAICIRDMGSYCHALVCQLLSCFIKCCTKLCHWIGNPCHRSTQAASYANSVLLSPRQILHGFSNNHSNARNSHCSVPLCAYGSQAWYMQLLFNLCTFSTAQHMLCLNPSPMTTDTRGRAHREEVTPTQLTLVSTPYARAEHWQQVIELHRNQC